MHVSFPLFNGAGHICEVIFFPSDQRAQEDTAGDFEWRTGTISYNKHVYKMTF